MTGFWKGLFNLFYVFFIDFKILDAGVLPDVVPELRLKAKRVGGVYGVVLQFEGAGGPVIHWAVCSKVLAIPSCPESIAL